MLKHGMRVTAFKLCKTPLKSSFYPLFISLNSFKIFNLNRASRLSHSSHSCREIASPVMAKRKSSSLAQEAPLTTILIPVPPFENGMPVPPKRRASQRNVIKPQGRSTLTNPDQNPSILDGPQALRASPDADEADESLDVAKLGINVAKQANIEEEDMPPLVDGGDSDSSLSDMSDMESPAKKPTSTVKANGTAAQKEKGSNKTAPVKTKQAGMKEPQFLDPEAEGDEEAGEEEIQAALSRPPPVNSDYLPLPWKGRLGYVRNSSPFSIGHTLIICRPVYVHICGSPILLFSLLGPVV